MEGGCSHLRQGVVTALPASTMWHSLQVEGDHLTLLAVFEAWKRNRFADPWCYENFLQARQQLCTALPQPLGRQSFRCNREATDRRAKSH